MIKVIQNNFPLDKVEMFRQKMIEDGIPMDKFKMMWTRIEYEDEEGTYITKLRIESTLKMIIEDRPLTYKTKTLLLNEIFTDVSYPEQYLRLRAVCSTFFMQFLEEYSYSAARNEVELMYQEAQITQQDYNIVMGYIPVEV